MKIFQLFNKPIQGKDLTLILNCFGIESLNDTHIFTKNELHLLQTVEKLQRLRPMLETYYLPCKARLYLNDMTESRALTILRQVLRQCGYYLVTNERNINKKKQLCYCIGKQSSSLLLNSSANVVLYF